MTEPILPTTSSKIKALALLGWSAIVTVITFAMFMALAAQDPQPGQTIDQHHAAILAPPLTLDQATPFELVEHAGDIRRARHQARSKGQRRQFFGQMTTQEPQHIVLLRGQIVPAE